MSLRDYIKAHYGTQAAFAAALGVDKREVSRWCGAGWVVYRGRLYSPRRCLPVCKPIDVK